MDYVLKPFREERLAEALGRARSIARKKAPQQASALAAAARPPGQFLSRVVVKDGPHIRVIPVEAGALGCSISGAGRSAFTFAVGEDRGRRIADAMLAAYRSTRPGSGDSGSSCCPARESSA